jgi:hypothetical protein
LLLFDLQHCIYHVYNIWHLLEVQDKTVDEMIVSAAIKFVGGAELPLL